MGYLRRESALWLAVAGATFGIGLAVGIIAFCGLWPQNETTLISLFSPVRTHLPASIEVGPEPAGHVDTRVGPSELGAPRPTPSISPSPSPTQPTPAPQQPAGITVVPPVVYTSPTYEPGGDRHRGGGH
jgi:hypothetical protein